MCSAEGCTRTRVLARGLCSLHYQRAKRAGELAPLPTPRCSAPDCQRGGPYRHGYCNVHHRRLKATGRLDLRSTDERFDEKWVTDVATGCHLWTAAINDGYGWFSTNRTGGPIAAHLFAYRRAYGLVPDGLVLDHYVCDNRRCCNPDHVRPTTIESNVMRSAVNFAAVNRRKTHCIHGHEFTAANTYRPPKHPEHRQCRACIKNRAEQKSAA